MSEQPQNIKNKLLADIEREWGAIIQSLEHLSETQITDLRDPQG